MQTVFSKLKFSRAIENDTNRRKNDNPSYPGICIIPDVSGRARFNDRGNNEEETETSLQHRDKFYFN